MFVCDICREQQDPHVSVISVILETRPRSYVDEETGEEIGFGQEIVRQAKSCKGCATLYAKMIDPGLVHG